MKNSNHISAVYNIPQNVTAIITVKECIICCNIVMYDMVLNDWWGAMGIAFLHDWPWQRKWGLTGLTERCTLPLIDFPHNYFI